MPKIGSKRRITLTVEQCRMAGIKPGDECEIFVNEDGHITIKKSTGSAAGVLKDTKPGENTSEGDSRNNSPEA